MTESRNRDASPVPSNTAVLDPFQAMEAPRIPVDDEVHPVIRPRKAVEAIGAYHPPIEGRRAFIRMDFNENTQGFDLPGVDEALPEHLLNTYPEYAAFVVELAQLWGVEAEQILLTNGSDEGLAVIASTFIEPKQDAALISTPTFALIPHYLKLAEAEVLQVPVLSETLDFDLDTMDALLVQRREEEDPIKLVVLASPDNPTGKVLMPDQVVRWCEENPHTLFVMDEAYAEYRPEADSALTLIGRFDNLLVTRTFSKAWGLAGLRLGAVLGHPTLVDYMTRVRSPYSVNVMAVEMATRLLGRKPQVKVEAEAAVTRKNALIAEIEARGYQVLDGAANFFMLAAGWDAPQLADFFHQHGVLLRDRSSHPLLRGLVRVSVGTVEENTRFIEVLDAFKQSRAIIFDLDDTLVDTSQSFTAVVCNMVNRRCPDKPCHEAEVNGLRAEGGFNDDWDATVELLKRRGITVTREEIQAEGEAQYLSIAPGVETLMLDVDDLKALAQRYRLMVYTGRFRKEYDQVWAQRLDPIFETVLCRDDVPELQPKPAPDGLTHLLTTFHVSGGYYVGNNVDDMTAAQGAGLIPVGVASTQPASVLEEAGAALMVTTPQHIRAGFERPKF